MSESTDNVVSINTIDTGSIPNSIEMDNGRAYNPLYHRGHGAFIVDPSRITLLPQSAHYFSRDDQVVDGFLDLPYGKKLADNLWDEENESDRVLLNAHTLNFLLSHQHLIPEEWKENEVYFWGTIYNCPSLDKDDFRSEYAPSIIYAPKFGKWILQLSPLQSIVILYDDTKPAAVLVD